MKINIIDVLNYLDKSSTIISLNIFKEGRREQIGKFDRIQENVWMYNTELNFVMSAK